MEITGPAGKLEAALDQAPAERTITAVLCHPHPLYGGSMHDGVLHAASEVLLSKGVNCLRFNFRGVGASEGSYDDGVGEVDDALAAITWVRDEYPRDKVWLVGYSFGAMVTWRATQRTEVERALLIAPPIGMLDFSGEPNENLRIHAFAGDLDDFVDVDRFSARFGDAGHLIEGADHFFSGRHEALIEALADALD